jgi:hypothetical protein
LNVVFAIASNPPVTNETREKALLVVPTPERKRWGSAHIVPAPSRTPSSKTILAPPYVAAP